MGIRSKVSEILDTPIKEGRWIAYATILDQQGAFSKRVLQDILLTLCQEMENLEKEVEYLRLKSEPAAASPKPETAPKTPDIKKADGSFVCGNCGKICLNEFGLKGHQRSHQPKKNEISVS
ncbi:MAG: hypothetical protein ACREQ5_37020 [Candidatus Dormibacteria bacterium]